MSSKIFLPSRTLMKHPYPSAPTKVIHLRGSDYEIGVQHAEAVGELAKKGMVNFYYAFWKRMLSQKPGTRLEKSLYQFGRFLLDPILLGKLSHQVPAFAKDRLDGLASVTGFSDEALMTGLVLPDLLPLLEAYSVKLRPGTSIDVATPRYFGCSSFVSKGKNFLNGRNLDFPGVAYWDRYPVIQVTERPGALRYIGLTTAGVPICGITGVNEAQLSVSLHQHYCKKTNLKGTLPFIIGEEILARARNLDEAQEIISRYRVSSSWAFVVTDGKTRDAFVCETHPKAIGIRKLSDSGNLLAHSNFFQSPECRPAEYATTARMNWDNYCRKHRLESLVRDEQGELTAERAVQCISDHFDPYWGEEKIISRTVSQVYNIQSVVMDTERMKLYFAEGDAPVQLREYQEYDLGEILSGKEGRTKTRFPGYTFKSPTKRVAKEAYILSFVAAFDGNYDLAISEIRRSLQSDFVPEVAIVGGVLSLKRHDYDSAGKWFTMCKEWIESRVSALEKKQFPPEYFEACLYLARTYDLMDKRAEANQIYHFISDHKDVEDAHLRRLASTGGPYKAQKLAKILMPYSTYLPFD